MKLHNHQYIKCLECVIFAVMFTIENVQTLATAKNHVHIKIQWTLLL